MFELLFFYMSGVELYFFMASPVASHLSSFGNSIRHCGGVQLNCFKPQQQMLIPLFQTLLSRQTCWLKLTVSFSCNYCHVVAACFQKTIVSFVIDSLGVAHIKQAAPKEPMGTNKKVFSTNRKLRQELNEILLI